ncbi:hypothetical protein L596_003043 [Steinernema carpocapsae]|uniref:Uncharacterized protein n=1 Tax=Steinernema carpocapsae TaxID=34508 RepID=A0A4U8UV64_STECR|nr:hypothetical protein L596_003043 [Steinernema carpocapsae]
MTTVFYLFLLWLFHSTHGEDHGPRITMKDSYCYKTITLDYSTTTTSTSTSTLPPTTTAEKCYKTVRIPITTTTSIASTSVTSTISETSKTVSSSTTTSSSATSTTAEPTTSLTTDSSTTSATTPATTTPETEDKDKEPSSSTATEIAPTEPKPKTKYPLVGSGDKDGDPTISVTSTTTVKTEPNDPEVSLFHIVLLIGRVFFLRFLITRCRQLSRFRRFQKTMPTHTRCQAALPQKFHWKVLSQSLSPFQPGSLKCSSRILHVTTCRSGHVKSYLLKN